MDVRCTIFFVMTGDFFENFVLICVGEKSALTQIISCIEIILEVVNKDSFILSLNTLTISVCNFSTLL